MNAPDAARKLAPPARPDRADVQALVAYGYKQNCSRHFVLEVVEPAKARAFVASLVDGGYITDASSGIEHLRGLKDQGRCAVNIGFTYRGLEKLGLPVTYLYVFREKAAAFTEGAFLRAARHLADTGPSAAEWWQPIFREHRYAHVLLCLHADEVKVLKTVSKTLGNLPGADGLKWNASFHAQHLGTDPDNRRAHFGMRDGIANPFIRGFHEGKPECKLHEPGELLLGYPNDNDFNPWLLVNPWPLPNPWLLPAAKFDPLFFRNGSFAAFRQMEQNVKKFYDFVACWAARLGVSEAYVKAKMAGRWESGNLIKPGELKDRAKADDDQDGFDFREDREGEGCPFGAHIRRMNPRADLVVPFRRRPLMRRGMPYGPAYKDKERRGIKRGLLGLFFCASLEDQFEHLLAEWGNANPMGPYNRGDAKDPLMGNHENRETVFDITMPDEGFRQLYGLTPFVTTRGTLYAFFPGCDALAMIPKIAGARP